MEIATQKDSLALVPRFPDVRSLVEAWKPDYPVYCLRPKVIAESAKNFISLFPGTVMYAVKCNPHPVVMDTLYQAGIKHFDVASISEVKQVVQGYAEAKTYFMHPVKSRAAIRTAYFEDGIRHFAIDHENELEKIIQETGGQNLTILVRLKTPASDTCLYDLAKKFGAEPQQAANLMQKAQEYGAKVGITFHVGSQCLLPESYRIALELVGQVLEISGVEPICLDVGGGFPIAYPTTSVLPLEEYINEIKGGLAQLNLSPQVEILAEPGRALVASGCSLITQVQLRKSDEVYLNDGIYGSLSELLDSKIPLLRKLIRLDGHVCDELQEFSLYGPTCDSLDTLPSGFTLPKDVREGDWVEIDQVGAYSNALATNFNGFRPQSFAIVEDEPLHTQILL